VLHNPTHGYASEAVWSGMAALRDPPDADDRRAPDGNGSRST